LAERRPDTRGVATWSYAPDAVFSYVSPLLTVALA